MKIVFITGQLGLGGAEKQLYLLVRGLTEHGIDVAVITLNPGKGDYWEAPIRGLGIHLYETSSSLSRLQRIWLIRRILRGEKPDIIHSWTIYVNVYAVISGYLAGVPLSFGSERASYQYSLQDIGSLNYRLSLMGISGMVTNSSMAAEYIREMRPGLDVRVVANGIEIPSFPTVEEKSQLRKQLGIDDGLELIGAVGSLLPCKNFALLIEAFTDLFQFFPKTKLVIIGDGPLHNELVAQAGRVLPSGNVIFTGALPNAARWLPAFDLLCMTSDYEGMPNVLMEASACGLPVVASDVGGVREIVQDGQSGILFPKGDHQSLTIALRKLLQEPALRKQMGLHGREKMTREFSVTKMVAGMINIYECKLGLEAK